MTELHGLNCMRVIARTKEAIYIRLPESAQIESVFAAGHCTCGHCDGTGKWDTVVVSLDARERNANHTWCVHMPDKAIAPFMAHMQRKGLA